MGLCEQDNMSNKTREVLIEEAVKRRSSFNPTFWFQDQFTNPNGIQCAFHPETASLSAEEVILFPRHAVENNVQHAHIRCPS